MQKDSGQWDQTLYSRPVHVAFGGLLCAGLYWLSLMFPAWPLHPIGILLANTYFAHFLWASVLIGWLCRLSLVYFGGSRLYAKSYNVFIGLFMGEYAAFLFWAFVNLLVSQQVEECAPWTSCRDEYPTMLSLRCFRNSSLEHFLSGSLSPRGPALPE